MIAIPIKNHSCKKAEIALTKGCGGKVFKCGENTYAVFDDLKGKPISQIATKIELESIPEGWKEI